MDKIWNIPEIQLMPWTKVREPRPVLLVTDESGWQRAEGSLKLPVVNKILPRNDEVEHWQTLLALSIQSQAEVVYGVGRALVMETAKYLANELSLPVVCLPSALDSDAFLSSSVQAQEASKVVTIQTVPAQRVVIDFEVMLETAEGQRTQGLCNVLAMATAGWDWKLAEERGKNPEGKSFNRAHYDLSVAILNNAYQLAAATKGDTEGLKLLLNWLCFEVQLCNQAGHQRPARGSEHHFAFAARDLLKVDFEWRELLGQGILLAAEWQGQDKSRLEDTLRAAGIACERLNQDDVEQVKRSLPEYCREHNLDYGIAYEI